MENWPTTYTIGRIVRDRPPADPARFLSTRFLSLNTTDYHDTETIRFDQYGPIRGMINAHELGTDPKLVKAEKMATLAMPTRFWKGGRRIGEREILRVRKLGPQFQQLQRDQLVLRAIASIENKTYVRVENLNWLALDDNLSAFSEDGIKFSQSYGLSGVTTPSVLWNNISSSNPVNDVQNELLNFRGTGVTSVDMVINRQVATWLSQNENFLDRFSHSMRATDVSLGKIAATFLEMIGGDLLKNVWVYDEGYVSDSNAWTPFVPDNRCFLIGTMMSPNDVKDGFNPEDMLGEFASTPAIHDGMEDIRPGMFMIPDDQTRKPNPYYDIVGGIYGMPVIYHPTWIRRIQTS